METLEWIFMYGIAPMVGAFIGTVVFGILKDKFDD